MGVNTTLLELRLPTETSKYTVRSTVEKVVKDCMAKLNFKPTTLLTEVEALVMFFVGPNNSHAVVRLFEKGILTIDITEFVLEGSTSVLTKEVMEGLLEKLKTSLGGTKSHWLPAIRRGQSIQQYFPTTDKLMAEYDFTECIFEAKSAFQDIKIMHSPQFGNVLILDDDINLAESDLAYTQAITGWDHESYKDKTVLVLGGGDGGILHEVLKQKPRFMTVVDIDGIVVDAAAKYLRGICYDSLDIHRGDNYEVKIADCVPLLEGFGKDGIVFDFVINDLTAIPCTPEPVGDHWEFLRLILDLSMKVLAPNGKYYTQGNGANSVPALRMYEKQLSKLKWPVDFKTNTVCVPSYHEMWVFYEVWKRQESGDESKT